MIFHFRLLSKLISYPNVRRHLSTSKKIDEVIAAEKFEKWLKSESVSTKTRIKRIEMDGDPTKEEWRIIYLSALSTFALHVKSRIASFEGKAFYTIGPCGEEFAAAFGLILEPNDTSALHYRHLAAQISRQLKGGKPLQEILLDRARGYVCSKLDPITGGRHCALGGGNNDFYVTSTLASQGPAAVGRALASALLPNKRKNELHFVSFGDGSVGNAHFLTSKNFAENAMHRNIKCPVMFCITDNDISISYKGMGWMNSFVETFRMPVFRCNGTEFLSVWRETKRAFEQVRKSQKPASLFVHQVNRRFGHAATDRQNAYLSEEEIEKRRSDDTILKSICELSVEYGAVSFEELHSIWTNEIVKGCNEAFDVAQKEEKLTNVEDIASKNQAEYDTKGVASTTSIIKPTNLENKLTMRKCINKALFEEFEKNPKLVYLGEDVRHGGYYLVTEGLAKRFPNRVLDFLPDETGLIGCGLGFSQRGLLPIIEIPYLKYLDCGADQFFEVVLTHWLTNGRQKNGVLFRLQGFDKGVFGGNFHTHNSLYLPPGLDLLCFSNGADWVKGFRNALKAVEQGRIVAILDPTHALNRRHISGVDESWIFDYPKEGIDSKFEDITIYTSLSKQEGNKHITVVTYGNGVPDALIAQTQLSSTLKNTVIDVIDCPLLSSVPNSLVETLANTDAVLFADCCKLGQNPFGLFVQRLQMERKLPRFWSIVAGPPTYHPLSRVETFLNPSMIREGILQLSKQMHADLLT